MQKLTLGVAGNAVGPAYWLDACGKMMNTAVVLLMDKVSLVSSRLAELFSTANHDLMYMRRVCQMYSSFEASPDGQCLCLLQGMEASQKAISSYCTVHRLLLALADTYNLWDEASNRLDAFLSHDSHRSKVESSACH